MNAPAIPPVMTVTLNPAIDLCLALPHGLLGNFARAREVRRAAGGKGINVSRVLAELNVASTAFCLTGGPDGQVFTSLLAETPFETVYFPIAEATRTNVTLTRGCGNKGSLKINQPGPTVTPKEWNGAEKELARRMKGRAWVVLSGSLPPGLPMDAYGRLTRLARRAGARVALDCVEESLLAALAERPDLVKPNRDELSATLGRPLVQMRGQWTILQAGWELLERGAGLAVISNGKKNCLALSREQAWEAQPPEVEPGGSSMGAGDSLLAGLVAGLLQGRSIEASLALGMACGAACAASPDTVLGRRRQIRDWEAQIKIHPLYVSDSAKTSGL